jgi:hypothetical protein
MGARIRWRCLISLIVLSCGILMPIAARADTSDTPDGSSEFTGVTTDQGFVPLVDDLWVDENGIATSVSTSGQGGCQTQPSGISYPAQQFTTFRRVPGGQQYPVYLDEYDPIPINNPAAYPALILVHGGGWAKGCRWSDSADAITFARNTPTVMLAQHFIVFAIDYRKACDANDPANGDFAYLCGWTWPTTDVDTGQVAAVQDVLSAVHWVRTVYPTLGHFNWNGKIALVGGSSGGHISTIASALGSDLNQNRPDVVAGFSSHWEMRAMDQGGWGCNAPFSNDYQQCWIGTQSGGYWEGGENPYLGCGLVATWNQACLDNGRYEVSSPEHYFYVNTGQPAQFYAGGGWCTPNPCPELVGYPELTDFDLKVRGIFQTGQYRMCKAPTSAHGFELLSSHCTDKPASEKVWNTLDNWLIPFVCTIDHSCIP